MYWISDIFLEKNADVTSTLKKQNLMTENIFRLQNSKKIVQQTKIIHP